MTKDDIQKRLSKKEATHEAEILKRWDIFIELINDIKVLLNKGKDF